MSQKFHTKNEDEFNAFANAFAKKLKPSKGQATIVALSGDLGVGKTTFTKEVFKTLGLEKEVQSPTFLIIKSYPLSPKKAKGVGKKFKHLYHIDTYRLEDPAEILRLGLEDILANPKNLVLIEWADKIEEFLPEEVSSISFSHYDRGRQIEYD